VERNCIIRHTIPTKFDNAPFGTLCQSKIDEDYKLFIQFSTTDEACWLPIGYILEKAFSPLFSNEQFIAEILLLASHKKDFKNISKILLERRDAE
jgi:hypothetical protein